MEFDPERTLIGGANESGKSTLIEAAHRALFLRAKTGGELQKEMVSRIHAGHPEVEISFEASGKRWRVLKRFSGQSGTATLSELGGESLSGSEAEEKLGELLRVEGGGRGSQAAELWGHLWIWQGCAADDPTMHANTHCADLLARLQTQGGAAAVQSDCDARVAAMIADRFGLIFRDNAQARAGSDLARAQEEERQARSALASAEQLVERLEKAITDFTSAEQTITAAETALSHLQSEQAATEAKLARVAELRTEEKLQQPTAITAANEYQSFAAADAQIRQLRADSEALLAALEPREQQATQLERQQNELRAALTAAESASERAAGAVRTVRLQNELAKAYVQHFERMAVRDQFAAQFEQVQTLRVNLAARKAALAQLPAITELKLRQLRNIESERVQAIAARDAMATGLEIVSADQPVRISGRDLGRGTSEILTEETEVVIGSAIRLRIRPGGGTSLHEARERVCETTEEVQRALEKLGIGSIEAASEALSRRQQMQAEIEATKVRLDAFGNRTIEDQLAQAENARAAAAAEVGRREGAVDDPPRPQRIDDARALLTESSGRMREAEQQESAAAAHRISSTEQWRRASDSLQKDAQSIAGKRQELAASEGQLRLLIETYGNEDTRGARLIEFSAARTEAQARLLATQQSVAELQPDQLERDRARLARAIAQHTAAQREAEEKRAMARGELQRDGAVDPQAEVALAHERARAAAERREGQERRASAIKLLHNLFVGEQKALAEQLTAPLAAKISGYLECLFGQGARAEVALTANNFHGLRLVRPSHTHGAFEFEHLSGGTKEQLAAAVRLAVAEVLAQSHNGCLPVVFDDAFAYSDPERVRVLQRMLDLAAERGLQVIVLTCNPADYNGLGAKEITLNVTRTAVERMPAEIPASQAIEGVDPDRGLAAAPMPEHDQFVLALRRRGGSSGNMALREVLGWDERMYDAVKSDLIKFGRVQLGRGKGGSVTLIGPEANSGA